MDILWILALVVGFVVKGISNKTAQEYINGGPGGASTIPGSGEFFDEIAKRYDVLNQVISLGYHSSWRRAAIQKILPATSVLDVSTGTADLAITIAGNRSVRVVGVDPSVQMLNIGRSKVKETGTLIGSVELIEGVAEALPFDDETFDSVVVAFGVRNFQDREKGLSEMSRVLKPGGKLAVLELSLPTGSGVLDRATRLFITKAVPKIAALVSGSESAYQYLVNSMGEFPDPPQFTRMLEIAGVTVQSHERLAPFGMGPDLYFAVKNANTADVR